MSKQLEPFFPKDMAHNERVRPKIERFAKEYMVRSLFIGNGFSPLLLPQKRALEAAWAKWGETYNHRTFNASILIEIEDVDFFHA